MTKAADSTTLIIAAVLEGKVRPSECETPWCGAIYEVRGTDGEWQCVYRVADLVLLLAEPQLSFGAHLSYEAMKALTDSTGSGEY